MMMFSQPPSPLLEDSTSSAIISASTKPTASNSLVPELPLDDQAKVLMRRLLISIEKSKRSRKALEIFESESRNTDGASGKQLKKLPMFLDPPDNFRNTGTRRKKRHLKKNKIRMTKHRSSSSSAGTGPISSQAQEGPGRRRAMSPCPPSPPVHHHMTDLQQGLESVGSSFDADDNDLLMLEHIELSEDESFDAEDNDLLMLEPIELSEAVHPAEVEQIELKKRLSYEDQRHARQQQPQGCFGQMRSFDIRHCNTDNYSAIQRHHHPQHQHQQHFVVTMHHHQQSQNNNLRYYPNAYPGYDNNADKRKGWSWSFHAGMHY
jgi:hypothetical protein